MLNRTSILITCFTIFAIAQPVEAQVSSAYLIRPAGGKVSVETLTPEAFAELPAKTRGLLIWSESSGDRWLSLTADDWRTHLDDAKKPAADRLPAGGFTRGSGEGSTSAALSSLTRTSPVDPGNITEKMRGGELITPQKLTLRTSPIVRRLPEDTGEKFPAREGQLEASNGSGGWGPPQKVAFPAGSDRFTIPDLKPGRYRLTFLGEKKDVPIIQEFEVASPATRATILGKADALAADPKADKAIVDLYTVESLLSAAKPQNGVPAFAGDILDYLEARPAAELSPYLTEIRDRLHKQFAALAKKETVPVAKPVDAGATGIPAVDAVRTALLAGRYQDAEAALAKIPAGDARTERLANLYRAMLLAEGGSGSDAEAEGTFAEVIQTMPPDNRADLFRAHTNFALFYLRRTQFRLNNHAFQMAAGVNQTITGVVSDWLAAREQYELAAKFGDAKQVAELGPDQARLYALLADVVRTLDAKAADIVTAAEASASSAAESAEKAADPIARGIALEIRGQLALRRGDTKECQAIAARALTEYAAAGFLPGVENAYRLLGQADMKANDSSAAIRHLTASHLIAELLRDRFSGDKIGRTRAGFFARRAFVLDALVELHLAANQPAKALELAEAAKARAFTDLLTVDGVTEKRATGRATPLPLAEILKNWPKNTAAVEYFLGRERVWAFVVTTSGEVKAFVLPGADGKPVETRELLTRVRRVVTEMEGTARKIANRILNDMGPDNSWQDELHELANTLLPAEVLAELRKAEVVLLAPQHVLHYLPFAALVLEKDPDASPKRYARPKRFLLDEPFVTVNVPSITGWDSLRRGKLAASKKAANAVGLVQAPGEIPLEGVKKDISNLRSAFGEDVREVLGESAATPAKTIDLFRRRGLLLLATHGYNDADAPLESFLVLYPDGDKSPDGRLRARDIYKEPIQSDVVVMNACYTGLGDRSPLPGDDLFGLQRAFLQAGARSVIAGLWDVYDLTAPELMGECLTRLARGVPSAKAMKEAQKSFLDRYRGKPGIQPYIHPYFWAVFSVLGDDQARIGTP